MMNTLHFLYTLLRIRRGEKKNRHQVQRIQQRRLKRLLRYAYDRSDYYRNSFRNAGIRRNDLGKLPLSAFPTIDKNNFMSHYDELVTDSNITQEKLKQHDENAEQHQNYLEKYHVVHSSGSTGEPRYFVYHSKEWQTMLAGILRGALWGISTKTLLQWYKDSPRILYIAATDGRYGGVMAVGDGVDELGVCQAALDISLPIEDLMRQVMEFRPNYLIGYPSAIKILAEAMKECGEALDIRRIFSCGEPLSRELRTYLETEFHTKAVNIYGASESIALGTEVDPDDGMILFDDLNIIEMTEDGIYLTCLYNFTQPLIRYHISDRLSFRKPFDTDTCGFTKAEVLLCRNEDVLWFANDQGVREFLHPLSVEGFCINGLLDYQFCKTSEQSFEMRIELSEPQQKEIVIRELRRQLESILSQTGLSYVSFEIIPVNEIRPDPKTGKKALIVRQ